LVAVSRTPWEELKRSRRHEPAVQEGYERARRAFELGQQVRALRVARGLTQAELAKMIGTSQAAIARLEAGGVDPRIQTLARLGEALGAELIVRFEPSAA
jgi:DNA-binding XRE family transcriptional regulator